MSPFSSGSVLKSPGTSTGVPPKVVQGFQSSWAKPKKLAGGPTPRMSTPSASIRSGSISPSIWKGSETFTGVPGGSRPSAWRSR